MKKDSPRGAIFRLEQMRRFAVLLMAVAVAASMAGAAHGAVAKTSGPSRCSSSDGAGFAKVRNRGTFIGRVKRGKIVATPNVNVNGCESRSDTNDNMTRCRGREITFNTVGAGRWRLKLRGRGIYGAGFVHGCLVLDGRDTGSTGTSPARRRRTAAHGRVSAGDSRSAPAAADPPSADHPPRLTGYSRRDSSSRPLHPRR